MPVYKGSMRYYLDTEFNGWQGQILSLALVPMSSLPEDLPLYLVRSDLPSRIDPWVAEHVTPYLYEGPYEERPRAEWPGRLLQYLRYDANPTITVDWPDDIRYFCEALITGPGKMINIPRLQFDLCRIDSYPTDVEGAIQHNAYWDAVALKRAHLLKMISDSV